MHALAGFIIRNDVNLFYLFNRKMRCRVLSFFMRGITQLGSLSFSIAIAAILILAGFGQFREVGVRLALILSLSQIIVQASKRIVNRPRPYKILLEAIAIKPPNCKYSFPSGHTCAAFSIALALTMIFTSMGVLILGVAFLVGLSRVYLGFHYPSDVLAGLVIAMISFVIVNHFLITLIYA